MSSKKNFSDRSQSLISLIDGEGVRYGREDSFKLSHGNLSTQRILLGIPTHQVALDRILHWSDTLGIPRRLRTVFAQHLPDANMVGIGLEEGRDHAVIKAYLEFWDKVRIEVKRTGSTDPMLLHLGFKWRAQDEGDNGKISHYVCHPLLSLHDILARIEGIYSGARSDIPRDLAMAIIRHAAAANPGRSFLYVEANEEGDPRKAFDINLYKSELRMSDIETFLRDLTRHYAISNEQFQSLMSYVGSHLLGHLAGALDQSGRDATTFYYETRALDP